MTNEEISKAIAEGAKVIEEIYTYQSLDLVYMFSNLTLDQQRYLMTIAELKEEFKNMTKEQQAMCLYLYKLSYNAANKTKPSKKDNNNEQ